MVYRKRGFALRSILPNCSVAKDSKVIEIAEITRDSDCPPAWTFAVQVVGLLTWFWSPEEWSGEEPGRRPRIEAVRLLFV